MDKRIAIVTGSGGVVGYHLSTLLIESGYDVVGIDNDMRAQYFGESASTNVNSRLLEQLYPTSYFHEFADITSYNDMQRIVHSVKDQLFAIFHAAGQPSHDWAAENALVDFRANATGTLYLLETARMWAPEAPFVFFSTNKVYGDWVNHLSFEAIGKRWDLPEAHPLYSGVPESAPMDQTMHSLFGCSKLAADMYVQEYGRYFDMPTCCFRCGCITGRYHKAVSAHGFLAFLAKIMRANECYTILGHHGMQVRDNIHASDLAAAALAFAQNPTAGAVYNMGGGRDNSCSINEVIASMNEYTPHEPKWVYLPKARQGDHQWWITDTTKFERDYPTWKRTYTLPDIIKELMLVGGNHAG